MARSAAPAGRCRSATQPGGGLIAWAAVLLPDSAIRPRSTCISLLISVRRNMPPSDRRSRFRKTEPCRLRRAPTCRPWRLCVAPPRREETPAATSAPVLRAGAPTGVGHPRRLSNPPPSCYVSRSIRDGGSSNGRTADSDSASVGSNPAPPAKVFNNLRSRTHRHLVPGITWVSHENASGAAL
jgi:hypothetical protein